MVTFSGPFFSPGMASVVEHAVQETERQIVAFGVKAVREQLHSGHGVVTGRFRASITGQVSQSRHGIVFARDAVKGPWLEGTARRNQTSRFKGYAMFRRGRERTESESERIADQVIGRVAKRLN